MSLHPAQALFGTPVATQIDLLTVAYAQSVLYPSASVAALTAPASIAVYTGA